MKKKILVLGGGPCGLSAAWELSKYGYDITVIEKESKAGGLCITNEYKGYRFDLGGHRFISKNKELVENVCRIMGDELLTSDRTSVILLKGKTFDYPLSARDIFLKMDLWTNMKAFTAYLIAAFTKIIFRKKTFLLRIGLLIALGGPFIIYSLVRIQGNYGAYLLSLSLQIGLLRGFRY